MEKVTAEVAKLAVDESAADRKLLIAVDFGTTYSGVAWAQTRRVCTPAVIICTRFSFYSLTSITARCSNHHHSMARQWVWRARRHKQRQGSNVSSSCTCTCHHNKPSFPIFQSFNSAGNAALTLNRLTWSCLTVSYDMRTGRPSGGFKSMIPGQGMYIVRAQRECIQS